MLNQPAYRCSNTLEKVVQFGVNYENALIEFYLKPVVFVAEYPEAEGQEFYAAPIGDESDIRKQFRRYKQFVYRHYLNDCNPATSDPWKTKDLLVNLLCRSRSDATVQSWMCPGSPLFHIISCYLCQITETADVERLMSVFGLQDSPLNQASTPKLVEEMVVIQKESPSWKMFDASAAQIVWRSLSKGGRNISLPPMGKGTLVPLKDKSWVKPIWKTT